MRKYDILRSVYEINTGISAKDIASYTRLSLPNVYNYLKELEKEGLVKKDSSGRYLPDKTNKKLKQLLDIKAIQPERYEKLISQGFRNTLNKLCQKLEVTKITFTPRELREIKKIYLPSRIVLRLSKKPAIFSLKINESLTNLLLEYHNLKPDFNIWDFNNLIERKKVEIKIEIKKEVESEPEVIKLCEGAYAKNDDLAILEKAKDFTLDERISALLTAFEQVNKEYILFLNSLEKGIKNEIKEQWEGRYIYNTNSIEGNTMSEKNVNDYLKLGKEPEHISKREIYETSNMKHSLVFLKLKRNEGVSEELIKEIHFMVQKDIDQSAGNYKQFYNYVNPNSPTTPPQHVKERMVRLIEWYKKNKNILNPIILASIFHMQFELIHPFGDGNGRVGRLLMNHILEQSNYLPLTILEKTKQNYYRALENRSVQQFLLYLLTSAIEEYKR